MRTLLLSILAVLILPALAAPTPGADSQTTKLAAAAANLNSLSMTMLSTDGNLNTTAGALTQSLSELKTHIDSSASSLNTKCSPGGIFWAKLLPGTYDRLASAVKALDDVVRGDKVVDGAIKNVKVAASDLVNVTQFLNLNC
ncbi:hypothetical protein SeLEV6574_g00239 [Synchytrium endobioticum]|nr:hypothetical protein SeLEV6574_g00239 [Synchytrium endobioticum]